jgi:hypothetical protein
LWVENSLRFAATCSNSQFSPVPFTEKYRVSARNGCEILDDISKSLIIWTLWRCLESRAKRSPNGFPANREFYREILRFLTLVDGGLHDMLHNSPDLTRMADHGGPKRTGNFLEASGNLDSCYRSPAVKSCLYFLRPCRVLSKFDPDRIRFLGLVPVGR